MIGWKDTNLLKSTEMSAEEWGRAGNMQNTILEIAKQTLGMETLETRKSDSLDFYELSVWQIRKALEEAFKAGKKSQGK